MLYDPNWAPPTTEIKLEKWQETLLKAADIIENEGWTQGTMRHRDGHGGYDGYCAIGAIAKVLDYFESSTSTFDELTYNQSLIRCRKFLVSKNGTPFALMNWNDTEGRTKEEVIDMLREAAKG